MGREKILHGEERNYIYSTEQWELFKQFRKKALTMLKIFSNNQIKALVYGSIARGNVNKNSDIDIILLRKIPSFQIELILEKNNLHPISRKIVQATPNDIIKVNYSLEDEITISSLLTSYTRRAFEFYKFGGAVDLKQVVNGIRVPGVDKRLMLIEPNEKGHSESALLEMHYRAAKIIGISQETIDQRIRVLTRRDKIGRTGVFLEKELHPSENVEKILRDLAAKNSFIRRRIRL